MVDKPDSYVLLDTSVPWGCGTCGGRGWSSDGAHDCPGPFIRAGELSVLVERVASEGHVSVEGALRALGAGLAELVRRG